MTFSPTAWKIGVARSRAFGLQPVAGPLDSAYVQYDTRLGPPPSKTNVPTDDDNGAHGSLGNIPQDPRLNHRCEVAGGLLADESAGLLQQFFRAKREGKPENEHHEGVWAVPDPGRLRE